MAAEIQFYIGVGIKAPIAEGSYKVGHAKIDVSYPLMVDLGDEEMVLPPGLSTVFSVSWTDDHGDDSNHLRSLTYHRYFVIHKALDFINELLQAYKLVRIGHIDSCGVRTIGKYDTLFYFSTLDGQPNNDLNVLLRNKLGDRSAESPHDKYDSTGLAMSHIGSSTFPVARRFLRCYELLEHGFYSESFIVAFSIMDDLVQEMLNRQLELRGIDKENDRKFLLRGIKESRLKTYLGPILKITCGKTIKELWGSSESALDWINRIRNDIAHNGYKANHDQAAVGIYACIKILQTIHKENLIEIDFPVQFFRHAKITASWTNNPPHWVPQGEVAQSMDYAS